MTHLCILRTIGMILLSALVVNISMVLAAPYYLASDSTPLPATVDAATQHTSVENEINPSAPVIPQEPIDAEIIVAGDENLAEESRFERQEELAADTPSVRRPRDNSLNDAPYFRELSRSSNAMLFSLGTGLGNTPSTLHRHVAAAAKHFARTGAPVSVDQDATASDGQDRTVADEPEVARIVLINPAENNLTVSFLFNGNVHTLTPGAELMEAGSDILIRFDRGGSLGQFQKQLSSGEYKFQVSSSGWTLETAEQDR